MAKNPKKKQEIEDLVRRCIAREPAAWDTFVERFSPLIASIIRNKFELTGFYYLDQDLDDLKQGLFLSIWEKELLATLREPGNVIPWICAISAHAASNYMRGLRPYDQPRADSLHNSLKSRSLLPSEELENRDIETAIDSALSTLNPKESIIIKLLLLYGKKYREISQILNIPIGTVLVCASRARRKLHIKLKKFKKTM